MLSRLPLSLSLLLLTAPLALHAASQEQEYQQVRTIALRDPRVRAAYDDADRRLAEKILKIDPALESYLRHRPRGGPEAPAAHAKSEPTVKPKPFEKPAPERSHVVLKGETLSSIATIFGVTVQSLKSLNHIEDERKLRVGQNLAIPERTH